MDIIFLIIGIFFILISISIFYNINKGLRKSIFDKYVSYKTKVILTKICAVIELICGVILVILSFFLVGV
jgi:hypothetical protein